MVDTWCPICEKDNVFPEECNHFGWMVVAHEEKLPSDTCVVAESKSITYRKRPASEGKWLYDRVDQDIWGNLSDPLDTREEALAQGLAWAKLKHLSRFSIGQISYYTCSGVDIDLLLDDIISEAYQKIGEMAEDWLGNITGDQRRSLNDRLNREFFAWLDETKNTPTFYRIINRETELVTGEKYLVGTEPSPVHQPPKQSTSNLSVWRRTEVLDDSGEWRLSSFRNLVDGDVFRLFKPSGEVVSDDEGFSVWVAKEYPYRNKLGTGELCINYDEGDNRGVIDR